MKISTIAIVELEDSKIKIILPNTDGGHAIAIRLAEIFGAVKGIAILHRTEPKR